MTKRWAMWVASHGVSLGVAAGGLLMGCREASPPPPRQEQRANADAGSRYGEDVRGEEDGRRGRRRARRGGADRAGGRAGGRAGERAATPGDFDFYLLNLSWSPEFCATHGGSPECGRGLGFVVHGLWPQDVSGDYPEDCSNAAGPADAQKYTDLMPTASLVEHEWKTHGTCSGLAAEAYFGLVRKAYQGVKIPDGIGVGRDLDGVAPEDFLGRLAAANPQYPPGSLALSCGNNRLTAVEVCLTKDLRPEACQGVRSCRANVVRVTPR